MKSTGIAVDKIYAPAQFTIRYQRARRIRRAGAAGPDYVALFLITGRWQWSTGDEIGAERVRAPGKTMLVAPGRPFEVSGDGGDGDEAACLTLVLTPALLLDCAVRTRLTRDDALITFRSTIVERDDRLARLAASLIDELHEEAAGQEVVAAAIVEQIIVHILRRYANIRRTTELELSRGGLVDRRIRRAIELMHAHLDRDLQLHELAAAAHLSPFHFARLFKKLAGTTPHAHLAALRCARAQSLLAQTDLSITEIAARVGYANSSHFSKAFRQATGLSPRAFRAALVSSPARTN